MITCKFENGDKVSLRHVTLGAMIVDDGRILLGKRGTHSGKKVLEYGKWSLIGGFLDFNETAEEGIRREIAEESGLVVKDLQLFRINSDPNRPKEDRQNVDFIYIAKIDGGELKGDEEVTSLKWFDLNDLPPVEKMAFDHLDSINLYKKHLKKSFILPLY